MAQQHDFETIDRDEFDRIDQELGSAVFRNQGTLSRNLLGRLRIELAREHTEPHRSGVDEETIASFKRDHFLRLGQPYDPDLIETIRTKFEEFAADPDNTFRMEHDGEEYSRQLASWSVDYQGTTYPAFDFAEHIPEVGELLTDEIQAIIRGYLGTYFEPAFVKVYRNYHVPRDVVKETEIYSNYWHTDGRPLDHFKLFVNLMDVDEDDGPFTTISRDDTRALFEEGYSRKEEGVPNTAVEDSADIIRHTGPQGSAMLANTMQLLHRAGNPSPDRPRDLAVIMFRPSFRPLPEGWLSELPLKGRNLVSIWKDRSERLDEF